MIRAWLLVTKLSGNDRFITLGVHAFGFPNVNPDAERAVRAASATLIGRNA